MIYRRIFGNPSCGSGAARAGRLKHLGLRAPFGIVTVGAFESPPVHDVILLGLARRKYRLACPHHPFVLPASFLQATKGAAFRARIHDRDHFQQAHFAWRSARRAEALEAHNSSPQIQLAEFGEVVEYRIEISQLDLGSNERVPDEILAEALARIGRVVLGKSSPPLQRCSGGASAGFAETACVRPIENLEQHDDRSPACEGPSSRCNTRICAFS